MALTRRRRVSPGRDDDLPGPITQESGECAGRDELQGQVLAADDDDDDMKWLEDPLFLSDYEFSDVENGEQKDGP